MAQITLKNRSGKDAGQVELADELFAIQPNVPVMHQVVTAQLAARRAGTQSTKTRAEVRGGGAKPYRQKGTGNARQGSTNSPHYTGGGIALGPKPRSYEQRTPKKMIKLALRSALSDRAADGKVLVVDAWDFDAPATKAAASAIRALGTDGRLLVVLERGDTNAALSFRNIPEVQIIQAGELNAYDVLCNDWVVFTSASLALVTDGFAAFAAKSNGRSTGRSEPATAATAAPLAPESPAAEEPEVVETTEAVVATETAADDTAADDTAADDAAADELAADADADMADADTNEPADEEDEA